MPDTVTAEDNGRPADEASAAPEDAGALAAEYVLGSLDAEERARASALIEDDTGFRDLVRLWERRLGELHLMVEPVDPPADVWDSIKSKTGGVRQNPAPPAPPALPAATAPADPELTFDALEAELREAGLHAPEATFSGPLDTAASVAGPPVPMAFEPMTPEPWRAASIPERPEVAFEAERVLRRWRFAAILMTMVALALGSFIAALKYFPDRLPLSLRPSPLPDLPKSPTPPPLPPRPPAAPPESQFDE